MANMSTAVGRMLNWAAAHPQKAGTIIGAAGGAIVGGVATQSVEGALGGAAIGGIAGNIAGGGIGHYHMNKINNAKVEYAKALEKIDSDIEGAQARVDKAAVKAKGAAKGSPEQQAYQKQKDLLDKKIAKKDSRINAAEKQYHSVVDNDSMMQARARIDERQRQINLADNRLNRAARQDARARGVKEARVSGMQAGEPSQPKRYREVERRELKKGVLGGKGKGVQTSGEFTQDVVDSATGQRTKTKWKLGFDGTASSGGQYYATNASGGRYEMSQQEWFEKVRGAKGALNGATDEAIEAAMFDTSKVAEEISQTAVGDSSGIFEGGFSNFVREHPIGTAIGAVAGGYVLSNVLDDD